MFLAAEGRDYQRSIRETLVVRRVCHNRHLIDEEFHRQVLSQQDIAAWRREGVLLRDATLARRLGQINSTRFRVDGAS